MPILWSNYLIVEVCALSQGWAFKKAFLVDQDEPHASDTIDLMNVPKELDIFTYFMTILFVFGDLCCRCFTLKIILFVDMRLLAAIYLAAFDCKWLLINNSVLVLSSHMKNLFLSYPVISSFSRAISCTGLRSSQYIVLEVFLFINWKVYWNVCGSVCLLFLQSARVITMNYFMMIVQKITFTKHDKSNEFSFLFLLVWVSATFCKIRKKEKATMASATECTNSKMTAAEI